MKAATKAVSILSAVFALTACASAPVYTRQDVDWHSYQVAYASCQQIAAHEADYGGSVAGAFAPRHNFGGSTEEAVAELAALGVLAAVDLFRGFLHYDDAGDKLNACLVERGYVKVGLTDEERQAFEQMETPEMKTAFLKSKFAAAGNP